MARRCLGRPNRPTALFVMADLQAFGCIAAAQALGLRVPDDVSIIGFDDIEVSAHVGLTTVRQHLTESGRVAARYLLSLLRGDRAATLETLPPVEVVVRRTTKSLSARKETSKATRPEESEVENVKSQGGDSNMTKRYGVGIPAEPGRRAVERGIAVCSTAIALMLSTSAVVPTVAFADPTEITVWRHIGDLKPEMDTFASFVEDFNASQSDWKVVWEELPQESYDDSINAAALSGTLPCMIDVDGPFVPNFAWSGNIMPLDNYVTPN